MYEEILRELEGVNYWKIYSYDYNVGVTNMNKDNDTLNNDSNKMKIKNVSNKIRNSRINSIGKNGTLVYFTTSGLTSGGYAYTEIDIEPKVISGRKVLTWKCIGQNWYFYTVAWD